MGLSFFFSTGRFRFLTVMYYTKTANQSQVKTTWPRFMMRAVTGENCLANLLPTHTSSWWPMVENILSLSAPATKEIP